MPPTPRRSPARKPRSRSRSNASMQSIQAGKKKVKFVSSVAADSGYYGGRLKRKGKKRTFKGKRISRKYWKAYRRRGRKAYVRLCKIWKSENRDTVTDNNVVYAGCGPATTRCARFAIDALIFELMRGAGIHIVDWNETMPGSTYSQAYGIVIRYHPDPVTNSISNIAYNFGTNTTFETMASGLYAQLTTQITFSTTCVFEDARLMNFNIDEAADGANVNNEIALSTVNLRAFNLQFTIAQTLVMQNQTKGGYLSIEGEQADDDQTTDVMRNPVYAKVFVKNGNAMLVKRNVNANTSAVIPDYTTGRISYTAGDFGNIGLEPGKIFSAKSMGSGVFNPGEIKTLKTFRKHKMSFQAFHNKFCIQHNSATTQLIDVGKTLVVAAEHQLKDSSGEQPLRISYEINSTMKLYYSHKPARRVIQIVEMN